MQPRLPFSARVGRWARLAAGSVELRAAAAVGAGAGVGGVARVLAPALTPVSTRPRAEPAADALAASLHALAERSVAESVAELVPLAPTVAGLVLVALLAAGWAALRWHRERPALAVATTPDASAGAGRVTAGRVTAGRPIPPHRPATSGGSDVAARVRALAAAGLAPMEIARRCGVSRDLVGLALAVGDRAH